MERNLTEGQKQALSEAIAHIRTIRMTLELAFPGNEGEELISDLFLYSAEGKLERYGKPAKPEPYRPC